VSSYVLVHGGAHGSWCWQPLLEALRAARREHGDDDGEILAVDLPPKEIRGVRVDPAATLPPALATVGLDDFATSAIADVDAAGIDRFVLVGHSMGGLTIAEVARRIPERIDSLVFVSCIVPPEGGSVIDTLPEEFREPVRESVARARAGDLAAGPATGLDEATVRRMFCNDMDEAQTRFVLDHCGAEAPCAFDDTVTRVGIPTDLPIVYVRLARDQALSPDDQDAQIANLRASPGGDVQIVELDTAHDVMISAPGLLASTLVASAGLRSAP
jgi:pimeloyl-ACP methyl ester carboxylesterase